ncbi:DUF4832 domain-containing protein [Cohnella hongkongensis]|uniref:DUF4832 domain-containing protein n=1 Tax=Cohnella hongkongensis TaxID=178337 RepID=A0ABV9F5B2_9BACL
MGKYSLENYERYRTVKIRPEPLVEAHLNDGRFNYVEVSWRRLEPGRGEYRPEPMLEAIRSAVNPVLVLVPDVPAWVDRDVSAYYGAMIRKVGSLVDSDRRLFGVLVRTLTDGEEEWNAYTEAFERTTLVADLHQERLIRRLRERGREFGLRIVCGEDSWLSSCEAIANQRLSGLWKRSPVLLHVTDPECGPNVRREARRWHAALSNVEAGLGWNAELRRLTYPHTVASGGSLPVRLWLVNSGTARLYADYRLKLRLAGRDGASVVIPLSARTREWTVGDIVHNEMAKLPEMAAGVYGIGIGLFDGEDRPLRLSIRGPATEGYYELGDVTVERTDRDPLENVWDTYYPDGYYPLEDPQAPQE